MATIITDGTSGTQVFAADNAGNTEIGDATPSTPLTVNGFNIITGNAFAQDRLASVSVSRTVGTIPANSSGAVIQLVPPIAGFGCVDNGYLIVAFSISNGTFTVAGQNVSNPATYTVF